MTTASEARRSSSGKVSLPSKDTSKIEKMRDITKELLGEFPVLKAAPDALYWLMATWGAESAWRLHFNHGTSASPILTSLHYTASPPAVTSTKGIGTMRSSGTLIGNGYQYSNVIQNLWNDPLTSLQTRERIKEGWYPHGISACMGTYHVRGCPNNLGEWRHYGEAVSLIGSLGLEVDPGVSIFDTLFPTDTEPSWRKSIASGMIIFNYKYRRALETTHKNNKEGALQKAVGNFLGKFGTRDNNGISPEDRVRQLNATSGSLVTMLQFVGLRRTGDTTEIDLSKIDIDDKSAKARGADSVQNTQTRVAATNSNSNGKSEAIPGCGPG